MKMFSEHFTAGDHCLCAAESLSAMIPATITDMINCSWLSRILDEDMHNLNRCLIELNFCGPTSNSLDYKHYCRMISRIASAYREQQLGQDVNRSKPKTQDSFIKVRQSTLEEYSTLLSKLAVTFMCCIKNQIKSSHEPLIS